MPTQKRFVKVTVDLVAQGDVGSHVVDPTETRYIDPASVVMIGPSFSAENMASKPELDPGASVWTLANGNRLVVQTPVAESIAMLQADGPRVA